MEKALEKIAKFNLLIIIFPIRHFKCEIWKVGNTDPKMFHNNASQKVLLGNDSTTGIFKARHLIDHSFDSLFLCFNFKALKQIMRSSKTELSWTWETD